MSTGDPRLAPPVVSSSVRTVAVRGRHLKVAVKATLSPGLEILAGETVCWSMTSPGAVADVHLPATGPGGTGAGLGAPSNETSTAMTSAGIEPHADGTPSWEEGRA